MTVLLVEFDPRFRCAECGGRGTRRQPEGDLRGCEKCFPHWSPLNHLTPAQEGAILFGDDE